MSGGTAVVTGASTGIGAATARALAHAGFDVVIGARRLDRLRAVAAPIGARALSLDVTEDESVAAFAEAVPKCSVLVNNAGGALGLERIEDADLDHWQAMYDTNVLGTLRVTKALLPALRASGDGLVVVIGSIAGSQAYVGGAGYNAAKFAERAFAEALRKELFTEPVRVTEIQPGIVETDFSLVRFEGDAERAAKVYEGVDALTAEDIADCVAFVATRPGRVNIDQMVVLARDQLGATQLNRKLPVTEPVFTGVGVALATLFNADLAVDVAATRDHAVRLAEAGMRAVIVAGSTGEASALERDERQALIAAVKEAVAVPVVAGSGAPSAGQASTLSRDAVAAGADALLVLSPPGTTDPLPYYAAVRAAVGDTPLLGYHYPAVSAPGIAVEDLGALPIDGCKDSSGDANRLLATLEAFDRPLYTGSSAVLSLAGPLGCAGAILGLANVEPEGCIAAFAGDPAAQRALAPAHLAMSRAFPAALKSLMATRWGTPEHRRLP